MLRIGVLFGMEETFPPALVERINRMQTPDVTAEFVSVGADPQKRRAATQTLGAFNSMFEKGHSRATIEWRFNRRGERKIPYAIIVRFHTSRDGRNGDVLVVSKVSDAETCHMAYIDALANPDAIALARQIADRQAKSFDCRQEPRTEGETGRSPM